MKLLKDKEWRDVLYSSMRQRIGQSKKNYAQIAEEAGVPRRWIDRFMQGTIPEPRFDVVCKVCGVLKINITMRL